MQGIVDEPHVDKRHKHAVKLVVACANPPEAPVFDHLLALYMEFQLPNSLRKAPPLAVALREIQQRVQKLQVTVLDVPPLH
jgi:hypothetical protein